MSEHPLTTVVLNTHNRANRIARAVEVVLNQHWPSSWKPFELVVVDDGSTDDTQQVLGGIDDPRLRSVYRENGGLSAARNTGLAVARGEHVVFLDDDDDPESVWLAKLSELVRDERVGIGSCGARILASDGSIEVREPRDLGAPFDHATGNFLAGCFVARADLLRAIGGYLEGLPSNHQTELALRLIPQCREWNRTVAATNEVLLTINRGDPARSEVGSDARVRHGAMRHEATVMILDRHEDRIARSRRLLFSYVTIAGVAAARAGRPPTARQLLARAVRICPWSAKAWVRLGVSWISPLARRAWRMDHFGQPGSSRQALDA